jgi:hypothetical protein
MHRRRLGRTFFFFFFQYHLSRSFTTQNCSRREKNNATTIRETAGLPVALFCSSLFSLNNIPSRKVFFFKGALKRNFNLAQQTKMKEIFSLKEEKKALNVTCEIIKKRTTCGLFVSDERKREIKKRAERCRVG